MTTMPPADFDIPPDDEPFWAATREGILLLDHCPACAGWSWYPRPFCPSCGGTPQRRPASGQGEVYSYTVIRKARGAFRDLTPYVVAYIELAEGPRLLSNVIDCEPTEVRIGMPVTLCFDDPDADRPRLYRFRPASGRR